MTENYITFQLIFTFLFDYFINLSSYELYHIHISDSIYDILSKQCIVSNAIVRISLFQLYSKRHKNHSISSSISIIMSFILSQLRNLNSDDSISQVYILNDEFDLDEDQIYLNSSSSISHENIND